jgi:hypothetical protein
VTNRLTGLYWQGDTDAATQQAAQYPIYDYELSLTGLVAGSLVAVYRASDDTLLDSETVTGTTYTYQYLLASPVDVVNIQILKVGRQPVYYSAVSLAQGGVEFVVQQPLDRWYSNP